MKRLQKEGNIPSTTAERLPQHRRQAPEIAYCRIGAFRIGRPFKIPNLKFTTLLVHSPPASVISG